MVCAQLHETFLCWLLLFFFFVGANNAAKNRQNLEAQTLAQDVITKFQSLPMDQLSPEQIIEQVEILKSQILKSQNVVLQEALKF